MLNASIKTFMHKEGSASYLAVQWFQQVWRNQDRDAVAMLMAPDARGHLEGGREIIGPSDFLRLHDTMLAAFPDITMELLGVIGDDHQACIHWRAKGTHSGTAAAFGPPSGKPFTFRGMTWFRTENGKIVEGWDCWNQGKFLADLQAAQTAIPR